MMGMLNKKQVDEKDIVFTEEARMDNPRRQEIGANIRKARENVDVSIGKLMNETGYQLSYIEAVEAGREEVTTQLLKDVARLCGVSVSSLLVAPGDDGMSGRQDDEGVQITDQWQYLTLDEKQTVADFFKFILEQKRVKDAELDKKYKTIP